MCNVSETTVNGVSVNWQRHIFRVSCVDVAIAVVEMDLKMLYTYKMFRLQLHMSGKNTVFAQNNSK